MIRRLTILLLAMLAGCTPAAGSIGGDDKPLTPPEEVSPAPDLKTGTNVYGYVSCDGKGIPGVVVSDGYAVTETDRDGLYQLKSGLKMGYVFISIPSGYRVASDGILPQFHRSLEKGKKLQQRDFELVADRDQNEHEVIVIGDIQLARRSDDIGQFRHFTDELDAYVRANPDKNMFALTLGDMTWDSHWLSGPYGFSDYLRDMSRVRGLQVFHAMGNHDHELEAEGDFLTSAKFRQMIGPSYYSFNFGRFHYVVLDNIECTNDGTGEKARYNTRLVEDQIDWLEKDLSHISPTTPVVIVMHAPLFKESGSKSLKNADELLECLDGLSRVYILSGHTHIIYNVDKLDGTTPVMELNSGAVCATWWYTGYDHPWLHIGRDGAPGGYRVMDMSGKDVKWRFKGIEQPEDFQFRSYDRNMIAIDPLRDAPDADEAHRQILAESLGEYGLASEDNYVYINVWDWDPAWKVEVFEGGKALEVEKFKGTDPLHVLAYNVTRSNMNRTLSFPAKETGHMFRAKASAPDTEVEIRVTDRFGRVYVEKMSRPKEFSVEAYMNNK